jgi:Cdc6-like AAA superfamily ATPase
MGGNVRGLVIHGLGVCGDGCSGSEQVLRDFPRGSLIMVRGAPGTGKTVFAATFLHESVLKYGDPGLYVSFSENKEKFSGFMRGFGMDFERLEERFLGEMSLVKIRGIETRSPDIYVTLHEGLQDASTPEDALPTKQPDLQPAGSPGSLYNRNTRAG